MNLSSTTTQDAFKLLRASPDFVQWTDDYLNDLLSLGDVIRLKRNTLLFRQGSPSMAFYVALQGAMQFSRNLPNGSTFVIDYFAPGQQFGLPSLFDDQVTEFDARAKSDTVLLRIERDVLIPYFLAHPAPLLSLVGAWSKRRRLLYEQLEVVSFMPLRQRLARSLLRLAAAFGEVTPNGCRIAIRVSQDDLASLVAASRQRVHGEFKEMVAQGLVESRYGTITVRDAGQLKAVAGRTALEGEG